MIDAASAALILLAGVVLAHAGYSKLTGTTRPGAWTLLAAGELAAGPTLTMLSQRVALLCVACLFTLFAAVHRSLARSGTPCGCFGEPLPLRGSGGTVWRAGIAAVAGAAASFAQGPPLGPAAAVTVYAAGVASAAVLAAAPQRDARTRANRAGTGFPRRSFFRLLTGSLFGFTLQAGFEGLVVPAHADAPGYCYDIALMCTDCCEDFCDRAQCNDSCSYCFWQCAGGNCRNCEALHGCWYYSFCP